MASSGLQPSGFGIGRVLVLAASALIAAAPSWGVERVVDYYFLTSSPAFGYWSGERMPLFIVLVLLGAICAGYLAGEFVLAAAGCSAGILVLMGLLYFWCSSRVCYSTELDGLEPLRMGFFLCCIGVAGTGLGKYAETRRGLDGLQNVLFVTALFGAVTYLPMVYTLAGVNLLAPLQPWPLVFLFGAYATAAGAWTSAKVGRRWGVFAPLVAAGLVSVISVGIASNYLPQVLPALLLSLLATCLGTALGVLASGHESRAATFLRSGALLPLLVLLPLLMLVAFLPDAVAGVAPQFTPSGSVSGYSMGAPDYAGAFMEGPAAHAEGVSVYVSFAGTDYTAIQTGNFLSAGIGVHAAGCCVDGIDYGYRFDSYLFHNGTQALAASAWEICDTVSACGGHSWKLLRMVHVQQVEGLTIGGNLQLVMQWENRTVDWLYSSGGQPLRVFASLPATSQENAVFNIGVLGDAQLAAKQAGSYFFQFGVMSAYPIGRGVWNATFYCPAYLQGESWTCVPHAETLQGGQSFWKALWRWGEEYGGITASSAGTPDSVTFHYSSATMTSFEELW